MFVFEQIWNYWFFVALLAPFFWALVNIIDVYFVDDVYEDAWDGILISSLFQVLPWGLLFFGIVSFHLPGYYPIFLAIFAGACLSLSYFFYFKTLFINNDVVVLQLFWNLSVPLVPFLAWLMVGEILSPMNYAGIIVAFSGVSLFLFNRGVYARKFTRVLPFMLGAVGLLSISMVLQGKTYTLIGDDFWTGFLLFSAGAVLAGLCLFYFDHKPINERITHIVQMSRTYLPLFILAECLNVFGLLASQRAIDLSPSVSFVAVIDSLVPIFVMIISLVLSFIFFYLNKSKARKIYQDQTSSFWVKVFACCIIAVGIYMIH